MSIEIIYKKHVIRFSEPTSAWTGHTESDRDVNTVKAAIDKSLKVTMPQTPALKRVWSFSTGDDYLPVTVTSITDDGTYWTVDANGKRERVDADHLMADTPANHAIIATIRELEENVKAIKDEVSKKRARLHRFTMPKAEEQK